MGKTSEQTNAPCNSSLSYTLEKLQSFVQIEQSCANQDRWEPLIMPGSTGFELSFQDQQRYLAHLKFLKTLFNFEGNFIVRSCNNFPHSKDVQPTPSLRSWLWPASMPA